MYAAQGGFAVLAIVKLRTLQTSVVENPAYREFPDAWKVKHPAERASVCRFERERKLSAIPHAHCSLTVWVRAASISRQLALSVTQYL